MDPPVFILTLEWIHRFFFVALFTTTYAVQRGTRESPFSKFQLFRTHDEQTTTERFFFSFIIAHEDLLAMPDHDDAWIATATPPKTGRRTTITPLVWKGPKDPSKRLQRRG